MSCVFDDNDDDDDDDVKFQKLLKSHYFSQAFNTVDFCFFSLCFSIWLTFVMHPSSRFS